MKDNSTDMIADVKTPLSCLRQKTRGLDELGELLEKQIKTAQRFSGDEIEQLIRQAGKLVEEIAMSGILQLDEFKNQRRHLQKLYEDLCLVFTAQKADLSEKIRQLRKVKKTIGTYRKYI